MKKENELYKLEKILNNNNFYNTTSFKDEDFKKINNICLAKSVSSKSPIILFQKEVKNRNKKQIKNNKYLINNFCDSYIWHKSNINNDKRNKTLNNTFHKKNNILKLNNDNNNYNSIIKNHIIRQNQNNLKKYVKSTNHSSENYSPNENLKKFKNIDKIISTKNANNNITNISVCLTNINMYHKNNENYSPSFCKVNKKIIKNNLKKNNINKKNKVRSKTFDYNYINNTLLKENDKNKTLMEKKMRYFLDYCKDDIESILKSNSPLEEEKNVSKKYITDNNLDNLKIKKIKHRSKSSISVKKNNKNNKSLDNKKHYIKNKEINNKLYNTFNYGNSYLSHNISTITNKINKNNSSIFIDKNYIKKKKKPRVDTFEYLAKILNSINTSNLMKSLQKVKLNEENNNKICKNNEQTDYFRKRKNNKNSNKQFTINNNHNHNYNKYINERRIKKDDINKYIEVKKKLLKINDNQKKKKEKEKELKKYFELYKLQENIFNGTNGNNLNDTNKINTKLLSKTKNDFYCGKSNKNVKDTKKNNNEILSSTESTIIDKSNYYQGILDIQNLYNRNNLVLAKNNSIDKDNELNTIKNDESKLANKEINNISNSINILNENKENNNNKDKIELDHINLDINEDKFKNNINNEDIFIRCQNTLEKANKIIGGEKVEYLINNFKNIHFSNEEEKEKEKEKEEEQNNKEFIINDFRNDYSFKLNDSNSNDVNSYQTSKFCNSQVFSEEKRNDENMEKEKKDTIKVNDEEKNIINKIIDKNDAIDINNNDNNNENKINPSSIQLPPTIQQISLSDTLEENKNRNENNNYNFDEEKLENYKEILTSLLEYLKLITQRNALNDIITYGDMKYKYRIGFEQLIILIKSIPFNIIRAIQQRQYYNFVFRQLFIPYISKAFHKLQLYSFYNKLFMKENIIIKLIFKRIIFKKIKNYKKVNVQINNNNTNNTLEINKKTINSNMTIKSLEELSELKDTIGQNTNNKENNNVENKKKSIDNCTDHDISESKEIDSIEWDNNFFNDKQLTNREKSNIIDNFTKLNKNENTYSADFNISIQEIVFEDQNQ